MHEISLNPFIDAENFLDTARLTLCQGVKVISGKNKIVYICIEHVRSDFAVLMNAFIHNYDKREKAPFEWVCPCKVISDVPLWRNYLYSLNSQILTTNY